MGFELVGTVWTPNFLAEYLASLTRPTWCTAVTLHHTAAPSLAQRPYGFRMSHIENIRDYYRNDKNWSSGHHLFVDEDQIFGMCDLRKQGIHASSFNGSALGVEVLGDYDAEDPKNGRGLACWETAAAAVRELLRWLCLEADERTVLFHRDDPRTQKTCPGRKVDKDWVLGLIKDRVTAPGQRPDKPEV